MKKIHLIIKALEWSQAFPNCNAIEAICCHVNQSSTFYGDLVYKFKRNVGKPNISDQFKKIIKRYKNVGYNFDVMCQSGFKPNQGL